MTMPEQPRMTFDEYLAYEESVEERHEFVDGIVYAMTGALLPHNRIGLNIASHLLSAAGDGPCHVYMESAKLRVRDDVFYPDVMVVCDSEDDDRMAHAPCLLIEVLSPSTTRHDRVRKLAKYQQLPSLRAYMLVSLEYRHVERHWRDSADAPWQREELTPASGGVPVPCPIPGVLAFDQIYRTVTVPDRPPLRRVREELSDEPIAAPA